MPFLSGFQRTCRYGRIFEWLALIGLACVALSVLLGSCLIARHPAFVTLQSRAAFALLLACVLLFFTTQVYFFDRDHIFFVLTFPYMLRFMPALARQRLSLPLRLAIALCAALGFCIKPVTLLVFALLQLFYIVRERSPAILWCLENSVIYVSGILYIFCVWHFAPNYISDVMPMAAATYSAYNRRINGYLFLTIAFISAGLTFADFRPRHHTPYRADTYYFIGVAFTYLLYALVGNGWGYTYNPLLCMLLFLSAWMIWEYGWLKRDAQAKGEQARSFAFGQRAAFTNLMLNAAYMLTCLTLYFTAVACDKYLECRQGEPFSDYIRSHRIQSFGTMSMNLRRWTGLVRATGASWDTRFNHLWMLPGLFLSGGPSAPQNQWMVEYLGHAYADDLTKRRPDIVFVDESNGIFAYPHPVDMVGLMSRVPEFRHAWRNYRNTSVIDLCPVPAADNSAGKTGKDEVHLDCRFAIYSRIDGNR